MNIKIFTDDIEDTARAQCETIMSTKAFKEDTIMVSGYNFMNVKMLAEWSGSIC